jgi:hypothetical protein
MASSASGATPGKLSTQGLKRRQEPVGVPAPAAVAAAAP